MAEIETFLPFFGAVSTSSIVFMLISHVTKNDISFGLKGSALSFIFGTKIFPQIVPPIYYTRILVGRNLQKFVGKLNFLLLIFWLDSLSTSMVSKIMRFNNSVASITKKLLRNGGIFFSHFVSNSYLLSPHSLFKSDARSELLQLQKKLKDKK
jgi:hypothetical protein